MFWRCQTHLMDSPQEFVVEGPSKEYLEHNNYNVCGGPYDEWKEAEFWLYGGPPYNIQATLDLTAKEVKWLLKQPDLLSEEELRILKEIE